MTVIKLKRVYDPYEKDDGLRVLVDRLWPRGVKKEVLHYDLWEKAITPSNELRKWMHADRGTRWDEFVRRYEKELTIGDALSAFVNEVKGHDTVTLLYASKDEQHNHAVVLKGVLENLLG